MICFPDVAAFELAVPASKQPDGLSLEELRPYWGALCIVGSIPNHLTQETTSRSIVPKHNVLRYRRRNP